MERTDRQWDIHEGDEVYGIDGGKVGSVVAAQPHYVVVEKGLFFQTDYYVPTEAIASYDDGKVYLLVTKDQVLNHGWDAEPIAVPAVAHEGARNGEVIADRMPVEGVEVVRVPVHEEELTAVKRERKVGEVRVEKDVIAEELLLEVPVTEVRVRVERRVVDRPAAGADGVLEEGTVVEVPIWSEEVELRKRVRVAEEVELVREQVRRTERVASTVRREEIRVHEDIGDRSGP